MQETLSLADTRQIDEEAAERIRESIDQNPKKAQTATITRQLDNAGIANLEMKTDQKTLPYAVLAGVAVFIIVVLLLLLL